MTEPVEMWASLAVNGEEVTPRQPVRVVLSDSLPDQVLTSIDRTLEFLVPTPGFATVRFYRDATRPDHLMEWSGRNWVVNTGQTVGLEPT